MSREQREYDEMRARVEQRVHQRAELILHTAIYVIVNLILWALWFIATSASVISTSFPLPVLVTLIWGVGLAIHAAHVYTQTTMMDAMREREMQREMRLRGMMESGAIEGEKPKRDRAMRLSDDGEMVPVDDADEEPLHQTRQKGR